MDERIGSSRHELRRVDEAVAALAELDLASCRLALVLGSGLKDFADQLDDRRAVPYADVPDWPCPRVAGHGHELVVGTCAGLRVA